MQYPPVMKTSSQLKQFWRITSIVGDNALLVRRADLEESVGEGADDIVVALNQGKAVST